MAQTFNLGPGSNGTVTDPRYQAETDTENGAIVTYTGADNEPSTPSSGDMVRWYDATDEAFKVKFDDGSVVTIAEK